MKVNIRWRYGTLRYDLRVKSRLMLAIFVLYLADAIVSVINCSRFSLKRDGFKIIIKRNLAEVDKDTTWEILSFDASIAAMVIMLTNGTFNCRKYIDLKRDKVKSPFKNIKWEDIIRKAKAEVGESNNIDDEVYLGKVCESAQKIFKDILHMSKEERELFAAMERLV